MVVIAREIAVARDVYAYTALEGNDINLTGCSGSYAPLSANKSNWTSIRVNSMSDTANRDKIQEEAIDSVAPAAVYAGSFGCTGQFEGAIRWKSFHGCGLLEGILGKDSMIASAFNSTFSDEKYAEEGSDQWYDIKADGTKQKFSTDFASYQMTMQPYPLAIRVVDEQAKTGVNQYGMVKIYRGCAISSAELTLNVKEYSMIRCSWIGRRAETYTKVDAAATEGKWATYVTNITSTIPGQPSMFYNAVLGFGTSKLKATGITISINRPINQDLFYIGSQFLQDLVYNGITELGGTLTLGSPEYETLKIMLSGSAESNIETLDQGKQEFGGTLANEIPSGVLTLYFRSPDGTATAGYIRIDEAKLTEASMSVQGRNQWEKSVNWSGIIDANNKKNFTILVNTAIV